MTTLNNSFGTMETIQQQTTRVSQLLQKAIRQKEERQQLVTGLMLKIDVLTHEVDRLKNKKPGRIDQADL